MFKIRNTLFLLHRGVMASTNTQALYHLKGGCTRFEVEHMSFNLQLYIGKTQLSKILKPQSTLKQSMFGLFSPCSSEYRLLILEYFEGCKILYTIVSYMIYVQLQILCIFPLMVQFNFYAIKYIQFMLSLNKCN